MSTSPVLAQSAYTELKERIVTFRLKPGEPLQEVQLAELLNVSRTPIREALRMLIREGLVEMQPRRGAYVASVSFKDVMDAYEVRYYLEPPAARKAIQHVNPAAITKLQSLIESYVDQPTSFEEALAAEQADVDFHDYILALAGNALIQHMVREARLKTQRLAFYVPPGRYEQSRAEHKKIVLALTEGNGEQAEQLMREHILSARSRLSGIDFDLSKGIAP